MLMAAKQLNHGSKANYFKRWQYIFLIEKPTEITNSLGIVIVILLKHILTKNAEKKAVFSANYTRQKRAIGTIKMKKKLSKIKCFCNN